MPSADPYLPRALRGAWAAFVVAMATYVLLLAAETVSGHSALPFDVHEAIQFMLLVAATLLVIARALGTREMRVAWLVLGLGLVAWMTGQLLSTLQAPPGGEAPFPSPVDF